MITDDAVAQTVCDTVAGYAQSCGLEKMWRQPITAFASVSDPRFSLLKAIISPSHLVPNDLLAGAKTIVCFFIPFTEDVVSNNEAGKEASLEWALGYVQTNQLIKLVCNELASLFATEGFRTGTVPAARNFDEQRLISDWSQRHVAWIAGLGTFGENNMLITPLGCCGRFGSLATDWQPKCQPAAAGQRERCLSRRGMDCGMCKTKCPVNAYEDGIFDRHICYTLCLHNAALHKDVGLADVCGKCICGLPCSVRSP